MTQSSLDDAESASVIGDARPTLTTFERDLLRQLRALRFGSIEITVHDGRVVQVERREKTRYPATGRPA